MFNLGPGEITVLLLLGVIFLGPKTVPQLLGDLSTKFQTPPGRESGRWTMADWLLLIAAIGLGAIAAALLMLVR